MTDKEITYHEVSEIADTLFARGEMPTITKVQTTLGKGPLSEISKHLMAWQNQKSANPGVLDGTNNTPPAVSLAVQEVLIHPHTDAEGKKTPENTVLDTVIAHQNTSATEAAMAELVKENQALAEKIIAINEQVKALQQELTQLYLFLLTFNH